MPQVKSLADFYPFVMQQLPDADLPTLNQKLMQAQRDFCDQSQAWQEKINLDLVAAQVVYTVNPPYDCEIKRIMEVWMRSSSDVTLGRKGLFIENDLYEFETPSTLTLNYRLMPRVAVTSGLVVKAMFVPYQSQPANFIVPQEFFNEWSEGIQFRALHLMMVMPGQRWSNPTMAGYYQSEFLRKVTDGCIESRLNHGTKYPGFEG